MGAIFVISSALFFDWCSPTLNTMSEDSLSLNMSGMILHADGFSGIKCGSAALIGVGDFMWTSKTKVPSTRESINVERFAKSGEPPLLLWLGSKVWVDDCMLAIVCHCHL